MNPSCYFCYQLLEQFKDPDKTGNYHGHLVCYNCSDVENALSSIWKRSCCVIRNNQHGEVIYLYLPNIKMWISVFNWQGHSFTDVKNERGEFILRVGTVLDIFSIPLDILENKIKTWVLFS